MSKYSHIDFIPPKGVAEEAERGLRYRAEFGRGGTEVGVQRAKQLKNRQNLSPKTIKRMSSYFARHGVNEGKNWTENGEPTAHYIAWLLWGGDAGRSWANKVKKQIEAVDSKTTSDLHEKVEQTLDWYQNCRSFVQHLTGEANLEKLPQVKTPKSGDILWWGSDHGYLHVALYIDDSEVWQVEEWGAKPECLHLSNIEKEFGPYDRVYRPSKKTAVANISIDRLYEAAKSVADAHGFDDGEMAFWQCNVFSQAVAKVAKFLGLDGVRLIRVLAKYQQQTGDIDIDKEYHHMLLKFDSRYVDFTIRQIDTEADFPYNSTRLPKYMRKPENFYTEDSPGSASYIEDLLEELDLDADLADSVAKSWLDPVSKYYLIEYGGSEFSPEQLKAFDEKPTLTSANVVDDLLDAYCAFHYSDDNATVEDYEKDFIESVSKIKPVMIPVRGLYVGHVDELDANGISREYIEKKFGTFENWVKESMKNPIIVMKHKGKMHVLDGQHRLSSNVRSGAKEIGAVVFTLDDFEGGRKHPELYIESIESLGQKPLTQFLSVASTNENRELRYTLRTIPGQRRAMLDLLENLSDKNHVDVGRIFKPRGEVGESILDVQILRADKYAYDQIMKYLNLYKSAGDGYEMEYDRPLKEQAVARLIQKYNKHTERKEWALVSKKDSKKVLEWYGTRKPSEERVQKTERRVQYFKHVNAAEARLVLKDFKDYAKAVAEAYEAAPTVSPEVVDSYKVLAKHNEKMFYQLLTRFDIEFRDEDSYRSFKELKKEVDKSGLLKVYKGGDAHPLWTPEQNWMFRAVHDLLGHLAGTGHSFSLRGELAAYNQHLKIVPAKAVPALFSEVVGQVCYYYVNKRYAPQKACYLHGFDFYNVGVLDTEMAVASTSIKIIDAEKLSKGDEMLLHEVFDLEVDAGIDTSGQLVEFIATIGGKVVGAIYCEPDGGYLSVMVDKDHQGKGIGDKLVKALKRKAKEKKYSKLIAVPIIDASRSLFMKNDFVPRGKGELMWAVGSIKIEDDLRDKYFEYFAKGPKGHPYLDIFDLKDRDAIELKLIEIAKEHQGKGIGRQVMKDLTKWADQNNRIIVLSPSEIKTNKLIKWYKEFDFLENKGRNKDFRFMNRMIRYPHGLTRSKWIDANSAKGSSEEMGFTTSDGEVSYRYPEDREISLYGGKSSKPVIIDYVQAEEFGKGRGTKLMKAFLEKMKDEGVDLVYLFAEYDPLMYEDEDEVLDPEQGLERLVKFYSKLGFKTIGRPDFGNQQIDMYLEIKQNKSVEGSRTKVGNPKYMTLKQLQRISDDFAFRGIDGKDYDIIREEIQNRLWELQNKKGEEEIEKRLKEMEEYEEMLATGMNQTYEDALYMMILRAEESEDEDQMMDRLDKAKTREFLPKELRSIHRLHSETFFNHSECEPPANIDEALDILYETDHPIVLDYKGKLYALDGQHRINTAILLGAPLDVKIVDGKGLDFSIDGYSEKKVAAVYPFSPDGKLTVDHRVVGDRK